MTGCRSPTWRRPLPGSSRPYSRPLNRSRNPPRRRTQWRRYVGRYRNQWGDDEVLIHNGELIIISPTEADPLRSQIKLKPIGAHTFLMTTEEHFSANGEVATFEMDEDDKVVRLKLGNTYAFPIDRW